MDLKSRTVLFFVFRIFGGSYGNLFENFCSCFTILIVKYDGIIFGGVSVGIVVHIIGTVPFNNNYQETRTYSVYNSKLCL